jgi:hypothetical protein
MADACNFAGRSNRFRDLANDSVAAPSSMEQTCHLNKGVIEMTVQGLYRLTGDNGHVEHQNSQRLFLPEIAFLETSFSITQGAGVRATIAVPS